MEYNPRADISLVEKAIRFSKEYHQGQCRASGEPFFIHPYQTAEELIELKMDIKTISAGLLHDVVEDTSCSREKLVEEFGEEIADLVDGVTKLSTISFKSREERQAENIRKMLFSMTKDIRVIVIKLADRLNNMRTIHHLPPRKQERIARETLEIYAPLATRLGMYRYRMELEDLAFSVLDPRVYEELEKAVDLSIDRKKQPIIEARDILNSHLAEAGIPVTIEGRRKNLHSIYAKMQKQEKDIDQIYDIVALRIVTNTVENCYGALGIVHKFWKPMPGRIKDYIAVPKSNAYQSLHTVVVLGSGIPLEIQIRTKLMHEVAETGVAAHWHYKEDGSADDELRVKLSWLRQLIEWHREVKDSFDFIDTLKMDLFQDEVFVFTPNGEVIDLAAGAGPVDFAYRIHTMVGHRCTGAKINGRIVPLDYKLQNGDMVEILTQKRPNPSRDWLEFVHSPRSREKIRLWFRKQEKEDTLKKGQNLILTSLNEVYQQTRSQKIIDRKDLSVKKLSAPGRLDKILDEFKFGHQNELFLAVGGGTVSPLAVVYALYPKAKALADQELRKHQEEEEEKKLKKMEERKQKRSVGGVSVKGIKNMLIKFAKCCNPVPGDKIIGFTTRGHGLSIHRSDCHNVKRGKEPERWMDVEWEGGAKQDESYYVKLRIRSFDRPNLLTNVSSIISNHNIYVYSVKAYADQDNLAQLNFVLSVKNLSQLKTLMSHIRRIPGVIEVTRVTSA